MDRASFLASLEAFHAERQVELSPGPLLGKTVDLYEMFVTALRHGGFPRINKNNKWAFLAKQLGLIPRDRPASAQDLDQVRLPSAESRPFASLLRQGGKRLCAFGCWARRVLLR